MKKEINQHDKIVVNLAIKEALELGKKEEDYVQLKIGKKIFRITRLSDKYIEKPLKDNK